MVEKEPEVVLVTVLGSADFELSNRLEDQKRGIPIRLIEANRAALKEYLSTFEQRDGVLYVSDNELLKKQL